MVSLLCSAGRRHLALLKTGYQEWLVEVNIVALNVLVEKSSKTVASKVHQGTTN